MWPFKKEVQSEPDVEIVKKIGEIAFLKSNRSQDQQALIGTFGLNVQSRINRDGSFTVQAGTGTWRPSIIADSDGPLGDYVATKYVSGEWEALVEPTFVLANWVFYGSSVPDEINLEFEVALRHYKETGQIKLPDYFQGSVLEE